MNESAIALETKQREKNQTEYERLKEKFKDYPWALTLIDKWAQKDNVDWEEAEEVLEMFS